MQLNFFKMHGAGNRILVIDERVANRPPPAGELLRKLGNEDTGPGFDQLMWIAPATHGSAIASYRVFNNDGSEVEQCGNGVRCVARVLAEASDGLETLTLDSPAGPVEARIIAANRVSVNMGVPEFSPENIPFVAEHIDKIYDIDVNGAEIEIGAVSMGNPHCVLEVNNVAEAEVARLGPLLEHHPRFPARANVGFMAIRNRDAIDLRVWERAVGETLACGTGACAAMAVARQRDRVEEEVRLDLPGGQLVVSWRGAGESVWLTGDAEMISKGTIDL
jgi:diaminopimelate epimerase